ncbi:FG-GAP repeat domain-containing protein [Xylanibacter brevis]|uniref:FG-GAP repeat domain-containing protein n=1 Tax=Xylanibacter brevis TaxID=83231 RepID=UPI0005C64444|nr:VCBS repeat-containing protein [Xylanibacter brevis]
MKKLFTLMAAAGLALSVNAQKQISVASVDKDISIDYASGCEIDLNNDGLKEVIVGGWTRGEAPGMIVLDADQNEIETQNQAWIISWNGSAYEKKEFISPVGMRGQIVPADFNGDGNIDVTIGGEGYDFFSVYLNDGNGKFTADPNFAVKNTDGEVIGWYPRSVDVADFNLDGLPDIVTIGWSGVGGVRQPNCGVLINNGDGTFTARATDLIGNGDMIYEFALSTIKAYDLNNDGYADFLLQGNVDNQGRPFDRTFIAYLNLGVDTDPADVVSFYDMGLTDITHNYGNGNILVADFNNDGTPDVFVTGEDPTSASGLGFHNEWDYIPMMMYGKIKQTTDGNELSYSEYMQMPLRRTNTKILSSTNVGMRAIDYNGNGYYDLFWMGWCDPMPDNTECTQAGWFLPGGENGFTSYQRIPGASEQAVLFLDYGNEGSLNYMMTGYHADATYFTKATEANPNPEFPMGRTAVFTKNPWEKAARPAAPTAPQAEVNDNTVTLSWTPAATAQKNVTYEYFIKDANGKIYNGATSFIGGDKDGVRKVLREGNAFMNTKLTLNNIPAGEYTWGVQTVAADLQGSTFATGTFTVAKQADGISNMNQKAAVANIFTIDGKRVAAAQKGLNIVKMSNGEVRKVMK